MYRIIYVSLSIFDRSADTKCQHIHYVPVHFYVSLSRGGTVFALGFGSNKTGVIICRQRRDNTRTSQINNVAMIKTFDSKTSSYLWAR